MDKILGNEEKTGTDIIKQGSSFKRHQWARVLVCPCIDDGIAQRDIFEDIQGLHSAHVPVDSGISENIPNYPHGLVQPGQWRRPTEFEHGHHS